MNTPIATTTAEDQWEQSPAHWPMDSCRMIPAANLLVSVTLLAATPWVGKSIANPSSLLAKAATNTPTASTIAVSVPRGLDPARLRMAS